MKKTAALCLLSFVLFATSGCFRTVYRIEFVIPAGTQSEMVYSDMEVTPRKDHIQINAGGECPDTSISLKQVDGPENEETESQYLTGGISVELSAQNGKWYKVGIVGYNPTSEDITVSVIVSDAEVRIS